MSFMNSVPGAGASPGSAPAACPAGAGRGSGMVVPYWRAQTGLVSGGFQGFSAEPAPAAAPALGVQQHLQPDVQVPSGGYAGDFVPWSEPAAVPSPYPEQAPSPAPTFQPTPPSQPTGCEYDPWAISAEQEQAQAPAGFSLHLQREQPDVQVPSGGLKHSNREILLCCWA